MRDFPKQAGLSPLAPFTWTYANITITLWCGTKQPSQEHLEEVVSAQFRTTDTATTTLSLDISCLATGCKKSPTKMDNMVLYLNIPQPSNSTFQQSTCSAALLFIHSDFFKSHCFLSRKCPSAQLSTRPFTSRPVTHFVVVAVMKLHDHGWDSDVRV